MAFPESNSTFSLLWFSEPNLWSITRIQFHLLRQVKCGQESWMQTSLGSVESRWYSSLYNTAAVQCTGDAGFQTLQFRQEDSAKGHGMLDSLSLHGVSECGCSSQGIFERIDWKQILRVRMYSVTKVNQVCFLGTLCWHFSLSHQMWGLRRRFWCILVYHSWQSLEDLWDSSLDSHCLDCGTGSAWTVW